MIQLKKKGGDISQLRKKDKKVRWDYIEAVFQNRIDTISIVNLENEALKHFFENSKQMVVKKIRNILKQYKSLKVNVIHYGKFRAIMDGEIIKDVEHFQTAN